MLIDRRPEARTEDPVVQMVAALDEGSSLILFPEGQRNSSGNGPSPLQVRPLSPCQGAARSRPCPVWIANLNRVMPKGEVIPVPALICTLTFGAPLHVDAEETKEAFLSLAPPRRSLR